MSRLPRSEPLSLRDLDGPPALVQAALRAPVSTREATSRLVLGLATLAHQDSAISLRIAMLLAWIKRHDVAELGYSSFSAFCHERVEWSWSWLRDLVRLVESPLDTVKVAACQGVIPLRLAVRALERVEPGEQESWLHEQVSGGGVPEERPGRRELTSLSPAHAPIVRRGRALARVLMGWHASVRQVDEQILAWHRADTSGEQLLAQAREAPRRPDLPDLDWRWCDELAPAEALVGPWREPATLGEAVARLDRLQLARRGRVALLARAWVVTRREGLWTSLGFASAQVFAREVLGWSRRTAQRHHKLGRALEWHPEVDRALRDKLSPGQAALIGRVAQGDARRWLALAERVGRRELGRAVGRAEHEGAGGVLGSYERAVATVDDGGQAADGSPGGVVASFAGTSAGAATAAGTPEAQRPSAGAKRVAPPAGTPPKVALPPDPWEPSDRCMRAPPGLPAAARWLVGRVQIPRQQGFGRVKERDHFRCQNPECGRISLRCEAHHIVFRSRGGSDDLENGVTVCRACHLRGIHTNQITVELVVFGNGAEAVLWIYPGGRQVLVFRRLP